MTTEPLRGAPYEVSFLYRSARREPKLGRWTWHDVFRATWRAPRWHWRIAAVGKIVQEHGEGKGLRPRMFLRGLGAMLIGFSSIVNATVEWEQKG